MLISIDLDAPNTCEDTPIEKPWAIGFFTLVYFNIPKPKVAPKIPARITIQAVRDGIPPIILEISIAIGVVTDLGTKDNSILSGAPKILAYNSPHP